MALKSNLFAGDKRLEACAVSNPDHVTPGATGPHVRKIQAAVIELDGATIDDNELDGAHYGPSTARAVLAYKGKRDIVNRAYQSQADDIVGIMTIAAMDNELVSRQTRGSSDPGRRCSRQSLYRGAAGKAFLGEALTAAARLTRRPDGPPPYAPANKAR